ncbi:MAG: ABC transporter ATP-binding protein [bacterium]|jgi:ABC-type lipoprotein export system ATPase subunit
MNEQPIVKTDAITKTYLMGGRPLTVLKKVSVSVQPGETVAIIGPSGAGKSTLLHALGGLDQPTEGTVWFKEQTLYGMTPRERTLIRARHIGFVFQSYHLLPELDVLENVLLPTMAFWKMRRQRAAHRQRAEALLETVGLSDRMGHTPLELSGGEQQRVALARALMNEPELVLADEPTGNLDSVTGESILKCLFAMTQERRHTLILVTHNDEVAKRCDRIIHMKDGCVVDVKETGVS